MKKEIFPYEVDLGAIMDFVENRFMLVIKDEFWTEEELDLLKGALELNFCYTQNTAIFVLEGGDIDSSDFYFNIQDCDWKENLLNSSLIDVELYLLNEKNEVCFKRKKTLNQQDSAVILNCMKEQASVPFMPDEYEINVMGIQSAFDPYELKKYSRVCINF
ncbi:MAG: hypothetical protein ACI4UK_10725 [Floccifex sp.]